MKMGRHEEAKALFKEILAKQEQKLGPDHPTTLTTRHSWPRSTCTRADTKRPRRSSRRSSPREQKLGPDHPRARHATQSGLALVWTSADTRRPRRSSRGSSPRESRSSAPTTRPRSPRATMLATLYVEMGRLQGGRAIVQARCSQARAKLGPDHPETFATRHSWPRYT